MWRETRCMLLHFTEITIWRVLTFLTSGPLGDKQQKRGENVESIKFSLVTQLYFMFSTYSHLFCCLSSRRPDISHPSLRFLYILVDPGLLCATAHCVSERQRIWYFSKNCRAFPGKSALHSSLRLFKIARLDSYADRIILVWSWIGSDFQSIRAGGIGQCPPPPHFYQV